MITCGPDDIIVLGKCHSVPLPFLFVNVHKGNDVGEIQIQTAEPLIPEPTLLEVEIAIEKLKKIRVSRYRPNSCRINTGWLELLTH